ncbi:MAG TPA: ROK family protein [Gallionellaceae bacterium]|nr:ROK family protein [Gallionellaceae bacterium]
MNAGLRIGVDVGGTNLRVGVVRGQEVMWESRYHADFSGICRENAAEQALGKIVTALAESIGNGCRAHPEVEAVGIGFPGFIDPDTGVVSLSPNLPGLNNVDIAGPLARLLGLPVRIENDALAAAYGEYLLADARTQSLVYLGLGTGVGGGLILGGRAYPGEHGVSMEVGHIIVHPGGRLCGCGNRGCLERYASASGVEISYRELARVEMDAEGIAARARDGDAHAAEAFRIAGRTLAAALAHISKVVDVATIVIGGGMSAAWPLLQGEFEACLDADLIPALRGRIRVAPAQAGDRAGMLGAAALAARRAG